MKAKQKKERNTFVSLHILYNSCFSIFSQIRWTHLPICQNYIVHRYIFCLFHKLVFVFLLILFLKQEDRITNDTFSFNFLISAAKRLVTYLRREASTAHASGATVNIPATLCSRSFTASCKPEDEEEEKRREMNQKDILEWR